MLRIVIRKIKSFIKRDKKLALRYYSKMLVMYLGYFSSKMRGRNYFEIDLDGLKIKLGFIHPRQYWFAKKIKNHNHEYALLLKWEKQAATSAGLILDCGGYSGIFGLVAGMVNNQASVYIFEPDGTNFKNIEKNIALNDLKNVFVLQAAVSDRTGQINFSQARGSEAGKITATGNLTVQSWALDDWLKNQALTPHLIKIDVEGAEYRALMGAQKLLSQTSPMAILLEVHPKLISGFDDKPEKIWQLLGSLGYAHQYLDEGVYNVHYWVSR